MTRTERLLAAKGWSQPEMAAYLGLSQSQVSRLVTGVSGETGAVAKLLDLLEAEIEPSSPASPPEATGK